MRKLLFLLPLLIFVVACTDNEQLAYRYKLDLNYYEYAEKFIEANMTNEAIETCLRTVYVKDECFITLFQNLRLKQIDYNKSICEYIKAEEKNITMSAFKMVYLKIDDSLKKELKEKIKPSKEKIMRYETLRDDCRK